MIPPILETARLILRPVQLPDTEAQFRYFNEWAIMRTLGKGIPQPYTLAHARQFVADMAVEKDNVIYWVITAKDRGALADELIGAIEVYPQATDSHRGFWLGLPFQGQGLMTEAATAVTDYWFDVLQKPVLRLRNAVGNPASRRIKEKSGATFIGLVDKNYMDPAFTQAEVWEITRNAWQQFRRTLDFSANPLPQAPQRIA